MPANEAPQARESLETLCLIGIEEVLDRFAREIAPGRRRKIAIEGAPGLARRIRAAVREAAVESI